MFSGFVQNYLNILCKVELRSTNTFGGNNNYDIKCKANHESQHCCINIRHCDRAPQIETSLQDTFFGGHLKTLNQKSSGVHNSPVDAHILLVGLWDI